MGGIISSEFPRELLSEVTFSNRINADFCIKKNQFYFDWDSFSISDESNSFIPIPMSKHPLLIRSTEKSRPPINSRFRTIFFAGNLQSKTYSKIKENFAIMSRIELRDYLLSTGATLVVNTASVRRELLRNYCILIDSKRVHLAQSNWMETLKKVSFFLAMPGHAVPHAHNIVEAMSVGTIPIVEDVYADMFRPPLVDGYNCFTFSRRSLCSDWLKSVCEEPTESLERVSIETRRYYDDFLSPRAIYKKISQNSTAKFLFCAEGLSLPKAPSLSAGAVGNASTIDKKADHADC